MSAQSRKSGKWVVLAVSFLLTFTFAISLQALPPLFAWLRQEIAFSDSQAGTLMGAYAIPGILLPFLVAVLARRFKQKTLLLAALLLMGVGLTAFSLVNSFPLLLLCRVLAGSGATVLLVLAPLLVTQTFAQQELGMAMGIFNMAVPLGTVVAANLFGALGPLFAWRLLILGIAVWVGIVFILCSLALPAAAAAEVPEEEAAAPAAGPAFNLSLGLLAFVWALANLQMIAYVTFAPQFFQTAGLTGARAALLASFIMLVPVFLSALAGMILDKTGRKKELLLAGTLLMAAAFVCFGQNLSGLAAWALLLGIGFTPIAVVVFALLPEVVLPPQVGFGLAVLTAAANVGLTVGPAAFGWLLDVTKRNFAVGFMALAVVSLVITLLTAGLKTKRSLEK
jgi:MFS family permease